MQYEADTQVATGAAAPASRAGAPAWPGLPSIVARLPSDLAEDVAVSVGGVTIHAGKFGVRLTVAGASTNLDPQAMAALYAVLGNILAAWKRS
jgi:hypothetical protein